MDSVLYVGSVNDTFIDSTFRLLDVHSQTGGGISLRVGVYYEYLFFECSKRSCEIDRSRCFSYTTFLISQSNNFSHIL